MTIQRKIRMYISVICLLVLVFYSAKTIAALIDYNKADNAYEEVAAATSTEKPTIQPTSVVKEETTQQFSSTQYNVPDFSVDFEELLSINTDCVGWIYIPSLEISYPVCKSSDNIEYLKLTFNKVKSSSGCIFSDCRTDSPFKQKTILYGHNMKSGTMFASLFTLEELDSTEGIDVWVYLPDGTIQQYVISDLLRVNATDENVYNISGDKSTLVLSTCVQDAARLAVICTKVATYL